MACGSRSEEPSTRPQVAQGFGGERLGGESTLWNC